MVDLEQLQKDLANGVIISRSTWTELVKYAAQLKEQRYALADAVASAGSIFMEDYDARFARVNYRYECPFCEERINAKDDFGNVLSSELVHAEYCIHNGAMKIIKELSNEQK